MFKLLPSWLIGLVLVVISGNSFAVSQADYDLALSHWQQVLAQYVNEQGQIDFIALANQPESLKVYVDFVAAVSPESNKQLFPSQADVMAYHINSYNALAMQAVVEENIPSDFAYFFKRLWFFKLRDVVIGGETTSLYDYENKVIRPLGEPRVHFALNCMVKDCPTLPKTPFYSATLEQQLEYVTKAFFNNEKHLRIDDEKGVVYVSEILDFYTEDFIVSANTQDLISYINLFRQIPIPAHYQIEFMDYDWTVNQQAEGPR